MKRTWLYVAHGPYLIGLAVSVVSAIVFLWDVLFRGHVLGWDRPFSDMHVLTKPAAIYTGERLMAGEIPHWNPYWYAGFPHLAIPETAVLYPTAILYGFFPFAHALTIDFFLHTMIAGTGGFALSYYLLKNRVIASWSAFQWSMALYFGGFCAVGHVWAVHSIAWTPLAFLASIRILDGGGRRWAPILAITVSAMILGGGAQNLTYVMLCLTITAVSLTLLGISFGNTGMRDPIRNLALWAASVVFASVLSAVLLLPSQELLNESIRQSGSGYEYARGPYLFRFRMLFEFTSALPAQRSVFFGYVTTALAFTALIGRHWKLSAGLFMALGVGALYAAMPEWLFDRVVQYLPAFDSQRGANRILNVLRLIGLVATTIGLMTLFENSPRGTPWRWFVWSFIVVLVAGLSLAYRSELGPFEVAFAAVAVGMVALLAFRPQAYKLARILVLLLLFVEAWRFIEPVNYSRSGPEEDMHPTLATFFQSRTDLDRVMTLSKWGSQDHDGVRGNSLRLGVRTLGGHHALMNLRYARFLSAFSGMPFYELDEEGRLRDERALFVDELDGRALAVDELWITPHALAALNLLNLRYIVVVLNDLPPRTLNQLTLMSERVLLLDERYVAFELEGTMPPVFAMHEAVAVQNEDGVFARLAEPDFPHRTVALVTDRDAADAVRPATGPEEIAIAERRPERITATVRLTAPAIVVFSEVYYPGWKVSVDGNPPTDPVIVNGALCGMLVDDGEHTIEFFYRPRTFLMGASISGAGLVVLFVWILWAFRPRNKAPDIETTESG